MIGWMSTFYYQPNPTTFEVVLSQKYAFLPRWWRGSRARAGGGPPDWYQVWLGTCNRAVVLGYIYRRLCGWKAELYHADADSLSVAQDKALQTPAALKAWEAVRGVQLGEFKTRTAAANSLKEESLDRGRLSVWKTACLDAVTLLGEVVA